MKYLDLISGIFWLIIGLVLSFWASKYPIGSLKDFGPGFFPLVVGILLAFCSLILLLGKKKKPFPITKGKISSYPPGRWKNIAYTILVLILAAFLFEKIGYLLTFFFLMIFLMLEAEWKNWKKIFIFAFCVVLGVYFIFVLLLKQPLPHGFLRFNL